MPLALGVDAALQEEHLPLDNVFTLETRKTAIAVRPNEIGTISMDPRVYGLRQREKEQ